MKHCTLAGSNCNGLATKPTLLGDASSGPIRIYLVAAELERCWEVSLRGLRLAEESEATERQFDGSVAAQLTEELKATFTAIGQRLPENSSARFCCAA